MRDKENLLRASVLFMLCFAAAASVHGQTVVGSISKLSAPGLAVDPLTNKIYIGGSFGVIDGMTNLYTPFNDSNAFQPSFVAVDPITNLIFASDLGNGGTLGGYTLVNGSNNTLTDGGVSGGTRAVVLNPVTGFSYFGANVSGDVLVLNKLGQAVTFVQAGNAYAGPIAVNPLTNQVYAPYSGNGAASGIMVIDGATNTYVEVADSRVYFPTSVAVNPVTNKVYATFQPYPALGGNVMVLDGTTNIDTVIADPNAINPISVTVNPVTNKVYVANQGDVFSGNYGNISVIDGLTNQITTLTDPNAVGPAAVAVNPTTNQVFVANSKSNNVTVIDGATNAITTLDDPTAVEPSSIAIDPVTNKVYVGNLLSDTITIIDAGAGVVATADDPQGYVFVEADVDPIRNKIYAVDRTELVVVDGKTNVLTTVAIPQGEASAVAVNPITDRIYVGTSYSNFVTEVDGATGKTHPISDPTYFFGQIAVNSVTNKIYVSDGGGLGNNVVAIDGATNQTTVLTDPNAVSPGPIAVNPVTDTIYVANGSSNNVSVINGSTNEILTVADPNAKNPCGIAVNPVTNKIYVTNVFSSNVSVIDGATNQVTTINAGGGCGIAVNWATNKIYVANNNEVVVIDGLTEAVTTITSPNALGGSSVAVDIATNTIFVANSGSGNVTVIDGITNTATTVQDRNEIGSPVFVAVNPATQTAYALNTTGYGSGDCNISVIAEQPSSSIPLQVMIQPLPHNKTGNLTPTFTFVASDTFSPNPTVIDGVHFQVDTLQGPWLTAKNAGGGTYKGKVGSALPLGVHTIYAFATDGQEATDTNPDPGASPLVGAIAAYTFLVY